MKNTQYINIQGWMVNHLCLFDTQLIVYAIIYGFSQDESSQFNGSIKYLTECTNKSRSTIMRVLEELQEAGLILKESTFINGVKFNKYKHNQEAIDTLNNLLQDETGGVKMKRGGGIKMTPNNTSIDKLENNKEESESKKVKTVSLSAVELVNDFSNQPHKYPKVKALSVESRKPYIAHFAKHHMNEKYKSLAELRKHVNNSVTYYESN